MEPFAIADFTLDYAQYAKFHKFHRQKGARKILSIITNIASAIGLYILIFDFRKEMVGMMAILIFYFALKVFNSIFLPRLQYKNLKKPLEAPKKLQLFADHFTIEHYSAQFSGNTSMNYDALYKVYETDDMFYLYINNFQAHLLPKAALGEEAVRALRPVLHAKLGKNFIF